MSQCLVFGASVYNWTRFAVPDIRRWNDLDVGGPASEMAVHENGLFYPGGGSGLSSCEIE